MAGPAPDITPADLLDLGTGAKEGAVRAVRVPRTGQRRENHEPQNRLRAGKAVRGPDTLGRLSSGWDRGHWDTGPEGPSSASCPPGGARTTWRNSPNG